MCGLPHAQTFSDLLDTIPEHVRSNYFYFIFIIEIDKRFVI